VLPVRVLSVVCHSRAPCLNRLYAILQVHFRGVQWHIVSYGVPEAQRKKKLGQTLSQLWKKWFMIHQESASVSDFAFCQLTTILLL